MNKDVEGKAIELTDAEMDNVVGGRAVIYFKASQKFHICNKSGISADDLYDNIFKKNTCHRYKSKDETKAKSCENCKYHNNEGSMGEDSLKEAERRGFDVKTYD